ncbi:MAG: penicillin-binding protein 1B [Glaciecola sp.]
MRALWDWFKAHFWSFVIVLATVLLAYLFYLDAQIKPHFSGNKWQVPAQIFARPLVIELKQEITPQEVVDELELLGYRKVGSASRVGEYSINGASLNVVRRAFHFPEGFAGQSSITLRWRNARIAQIIQDQRQVNAIRLEPWLVTRLSSGSREDRMLVTQADLPPLLLDALVLVEDRNFYTHWGVNPLAIVRALLANISAGRKVQGGSTLTQQLVKNLYLTREQSYTRKLKEALMALVIDARYSKDEIIIAYVNEVFVGQNGGKAVHGFGLGSHFYFDRPLNELNLPEIATLVGMLKGPSYYNPKRKPERAKTRRDLVLRILFEADKIDKATYLAAIEAPLTVASGASLASGKHPAFMDKVRRELKTVLADPDLRSSGVKVFTSLDINAQRRAEQALKQRTESIAKTRKLDNLQASMVVSDIRTGELRVIIGSRYVDESGFNRALDMQRSIGSLVKPAIYLTALEQADTYHLATILKDAPLSLTTDDGQVWEPQNADKEYRGAVPLLQALTQSYNLPAVDTALNLGLSNLIDTIQRLGIDKPIAQLPAITLGAVNLAPVDVVQMYQTLANNGEYRPVHTVTAVVSADNELLWQHGGYHDQRVDEAVTYLLNYALHKVTKDGTAKSLGKRFPKVNMAGKTGTTNDYRDSWFAGFDRNLVSAIWVGDDNNATTGLSGSSGALRIYSDWQQTMTPKSLSQRFPEGVVIAHFDPTSGARMTPGCPDNVSLPAIKSGLSELVKTCQGQVQKEQPPAPKPKQKSWWKRLLGG